MTHLVPKVKVAWRQIRTSSRPWLRATSNDPSQRIVGIQQLLHETVTVTRSSILLRRALGAGLTRRGHPASDFPDRLCPLLVDCLFSHKLMRGADAARESPTASLCGFSLKAVCGLSGIRVEAPQKKGGLRQCHRYQKYRHADPRYVKSLVPHWLRECPRARLLVAIFNACLRNCYFPPIWKEAKVIDIYKPGKPRDLPASYRPTSFLSGLGKLFEGILKTPLSDYFFGKGLIIDELFGFRPVHSRPQQVLRLVEYKGFKSKQKKP
ncbi:Probable RNA-directed DNA polymerase from transposon X-element [Eumeta japonica]|uniref:Probable RNA-directed DNA polymerase from transposon X-element n=1 Tax=Eumeta variegata TaxID=151549 RepID=A0A4C1XSJ6_EUMVA|nr:Probable RNA-directed DNA polymerase from transposon X-element [Eumeta japonica]